MMTSMSSAFEEHERKCKIYLEMLPNFRKQLLIEKTNAKTTMQIYFGSIQLADYMKSFLEVRKDFIELYTFKDIFEDNNFLPVNDLWLFVENINSEKNNFSYLIDGDFLNSKARTLKLWEVDYENILDNYENYLNILLDKLQGIKDSWFDFYKHLENDNKIKDNKVFLDKDNMEIYKLISVPNEETPLFGLKRVQFYLSYKPQVSDILLHPDNIRESIKHEVFLDERLGEFYPEYFI